MDKKSFLIGFLTASILMLTALFFISATQQKIDSVVTRSQPSPVVEKLTQLEEKINLINERTVKIEANTVQTYQDLHRMWKELYELCKK